MKHDFDSISSVLTDFGKGRMVIVVDDERRENEGDLIVSAELVTPDHINFMTRHGRGIVCVPMEGSAIDRIGLQPMTPVSTDPKKTAWTVSVDARNGTTTGVSVFDRALTIRALVRSGATVDDFILPGHVFPLRSHTGGIRSRAGHTEASVELARRCGLFPAAVICEIMNDDGSMARFSDLMEFSARHNMRICSIANLMESL